MNTNEIVARKSGARVQKPRNSQLATRNSFIATRNSPARQGILLLVVLSMLTLFLLIGTAFIVSANHYRQINKIQARITETSNSSIDQGDLLNEVINQLIRDTNNQNSTLRFHSLLRDMYGNDGILAEIDQSGWAGGGTNGGITAGQMLEFNVYLNAGSANDPRNPRNIVSVPAPLSAIDNAYNGLVLTFLDGPVRGQSTRIVGYRPAITGVGAVPAVFRVMTVRKTDGSTITDGTNGTTNDFADFSGGRILINGRPFNGTGVGYDRTATTGPRLGFDETVPNSGLAEIALTPNGVFTNTDQISDEYFFTAPQLADLNTLSPEDRVTLRAQIASASSLTGLGGSDESYDAVDFQNMALSLTQQNPVETVLPNLANPDPTNLDQMLIPSYHRPALLNYWRQQPTGGGPTLDNNANLLRKVLLRPSWLDHPNFTGSNPDFASLPNAPAGNTDRLRRMIYGPWDVDNDNDGIRDSVWVDVGLPVMENKDGRLVKPLAAIMVLDMDGRLNMNAHGSEDVAAAGVAGSGIPAPPRQPIAGVGNMSDLLPHGQGYGPAEISLDPLMPSTDRELRWRWYKRFIGGATVDESIVPSRLGLATLDTRKFRRKLVGKYGTITPNSSATKPWAGRDGLDIASQLKLSGMPQWANGRMSVQDNTGNFFLGGYATPPDPRGRYGLGLNAMGQPVYEAQFEPTIGPNADHARLDADTPYELDLSLGAARGESDGAPDGPYTLSELERVLRAYDADAGTLPSRIWEYAGGFRDANQSVPNVTQLNRWRSSLTTDSYDLPVPSVVVPPWMRVGPNGILDGPGTTSDDFDEVVSRPMGGASFADLLEYRIRFELNPANPSASLSAANAQVLRREMRKLLPRDLADGLRLDINRPLGNGRDDNDNGVVDEPGENEGAFWASTNRQLDAFTGNDGNNYGQFRDAVDRDGNGTISAFERGDTDGSGTLSSVERVALHNFRRQLLARDLYVLALTLVDGFNLESTAGKNKTRQIAQWAINTVDFRDPDNIMTAFEYDENPFDGWGVNGNLDGNLDSSSPDNNEPQRGVVWGTERPELLITETLGWHDRRTADTANEVADLGEERGTVSEGKDDDYDQKQPPRGYGFIELYNPWPENPATNRDTYGIDAAGDLGVALARVTPVRSGETDPDPVWRMVVYKSAGASKDLDESDTDNLPLDRGFKQLADRSIYFTDDPFRTDPSRSFGNDGVAFYSSLNVPAVPAGGYMVIGSGENQGGGQFMACFGENIVSGEQRGITLNTATYAAMPNSVMVESTSGVAVDDSDGFSMEANNLTNPDAVRIAVINSPRRFSFSEPAHGYPDLIPGDTEYNPPRDVPFDDQRIYRGNAVDADGNVAATGRARLQDGETRLTLPEKSTGGRTIPGFSWVYLQRLANPLLPWNPVPLLPDGTTNTKHLANEPVNPYLTVDTMGANVTVFNGLAEREARWPEGADRSNFSEIEKFANFDAIDAFASLQRGRSNSPTSTGSQLQELQEAARGAQNPTAITQPLVPANLWNYETVGTAAGAGAAFGGFWKNQAGPNSRGDDTNSSRFNFGGIPDCTLGFLNEPFRRAAPANVLEAKTEPEQPFAWLNWNNRPFANTNELILVPGYRSSQLLQAYSMSTAATATESYQGNVKELELSGTLTLETDGPFGHLMNFFRTEGGGTANDKGIVGLHRMLEFIHVPSPFVGTEMWLNPARFGNENLTSVDDPRYSRQPPFNRISNYRDPGRVNLNTMVHQDVYRGLMHGDASPTATGTVHPGPTWNSLVNSRQGKAGLGASLLALDNDLPSFFSNPFRASGASDLVPLQEMIVSGDVHSTLMRGTRGPGRLDGLAAAVSGNLTGANLFASTVNNDYNNAARNPYFRYQSVTRLSSMTTARSNVYAVWVTIGFFEVEEAPSWIANDRFPTPTSTTRVQDVFPTQELYDRVYPEGYWLGQEAGSDTGDLSRVREFAIIDRTVPVAFEPGRNHNVDKAIRLRRRID